MILGYCVQGEEHPGGLAQAKTKFSGWIQSFPGARSVECLAGSRVRDQRRGGKSSVHGALLGALQ